MHDSESRPKSPSRCADLRLALFAFTCSLPPWTSVFWVEALGVGYFFSTLTTQGILCPPRNPPLSIFPSEALGLGYFFSMRGFGERETSSLPMRQELSAPSPQSSFVDFVCGGFGSGLLLDIIVTTINLCPPRNPPFVQLEMCFRVQKIVYTSRIVRVILVEGPC